MSKKIMIFDDDHDILEVTSLILSKRHYKVKAVNDLHDFLDKILKFQPNVILMDIRIPELGGKEATRIIKKTMRTKNIPVILFTAHNKGKDDLINMTGAQDVLFKPFNIKTLVRKIEAVM